MYKHLFAATLMGACLVAPAFAQVPDATIKWTNVQESLAGVVMGIQMHGSAANKVSGQWTIYAIGGNRTDTGDSANISYAPLNLDPVTIGTWADTTFEFPKDTAGNAVGSAYIERMTFFL